MATDSEVAKHFTDPMRKRFTVPAGLNEADFKDDLAEGLASYSVYQLACASNWFRDNRTQRAFPTVAECRHRCEEFAAERGAQVERSAGARNWKTDAELREDEKQRDEREARAVEMLRGTREAEGALKDGWLVRLIEFATDNQRLPDMEECTALYHASKATDANLHRGGIDKGLYRKLCEMRVNAKLKAIRKVFGREEEAKWEARLRLPPEKTDEAARQAALLHLEALEAYNKTSPIQIGAPLRAKLAAMRDEQQPMAEAAE